MIAVTIAEGDNYVELAQQAMQSVEHHTGLRVFILSKTELGEVPFLYPETPVHWLKTRIPEFCFRELGETFVFYVDADTRMLRDWDVVGQFEHAGMNSLIAAPDLSGVIAHTPEKDKIIADCKYLDIDPSLYWNAGVLILKYEIAQRMMDEAQELAFMLWRERHVRMRFQEQTYLNWAAQKLQIPVLYLDRRYNYIGYGHGRFGGTPSGVVIAHAAGGGRPLKDLLVQLGKDTGA